ncbi:MAG: double-strand break repair protein AddB [Yoonia sp.]|jgi:double-strand break repair protein AddB
MFNASKTPRIFGMAPGGDFATALVAGLQQQGRDLSPTDWASVEIFVNTSRTQRRIRSVFDAGPARLLPRVRLITDLANDPSIDAGPPSVSPLRRRLELSQLVAALLIQDDKLAPRSALYDLSDSLATLMEEMHGEGVSPDVFETLDVTDESGHWDRALKFLQIVTPYFGKNKAPDKDLRLRRVVSGLAEKWAVNPPQHPIIIAGSTGSRGATSLLMLAIAKLPQGAVVLPGFDFDLPADVWESMTDARVSEDHPQYRFHRFLASAGVSPKDVPAWPDSAAPNPHRNKMVSLSLRPAPVTDQWLRDGPDLGDLQAATQNITLIEAASPRAEAEAIALRLRVAAQDGITAALISPDRMLTRQVTAALDRWDIKPDDSAGLPLALSPPGRMLRHTADLFGQAITSEGLLTLLKHPLCHSDRDDRGLHLRFTRELELSLRRYGPPFPSPDALTKWAAKTENEDGARAIWAAWIGVMINGIDDIASRDLTDHLAAHLAFTEQLCAGPSTDGTGELWKEAAGREARRVCDTLTTHADAGGDLTPFEYTNLFGAVLADGTVRDRDAAHPNILIWGTLEARVQGADLVILGGMNEGIWPEAASPDPWLNRNMRRDAGLLLPERRIGLSAHDYQQAVAAKEVWISRAKRSSDSETVSSRWVNRLVNLLGGLPDQNGPAALARMRADGDIWLAQSAALSVPDAPVPNAHRPSPQPPIAARPTSISVTQVKTLIRDPYSIYARKILRLNRLDPLTPRVDASLRGMIVHEILENFVAQGSDANAPDARAELMGIAEQIFTRDCPWPTIRAQWLSRLDRVADRFIAGEIERQAVGTPILGIKDGETVVEQDGKIAVGTTGVDLTCKADRLDLTIEGLAIIYDYKTGSVPTKNQQIAFDKQLLLEAAMIELGAFKAVGPVIAEGATFVAVNTGMRDVPAPLKDHPAMQVWDDFQALLMEYQQKSRGYSARIAMFSTTDYSNYDHLSRFGEWDTSDNAVPEDLT